MKNVKKLLALLLALAMLFAVCACSDSKDEDRDDKKGAATATQAANADSSQNNQNKEDDKLTADKLEGTWEATLNLDALSYLMGEDVTVYDELGISLGTCKLDIVFTDDEATIKTSGLVDWYVDLMETVVDWCYEGDNMLVYMAQMMSDEDIQYTAADIEEMLAEEGSSVEDLLDETFGAMDMEEMAAMLAEELSDETSDYVLDGDKLSFDDGNSVWTVSYADGKIDVLSVDEDGEVTGLDKGDFVLEKK